VSALNVPLDEGLSWNVIVADGVIFVPVLVSVTVAMHVAVWLSSTSVELQVIVVEVVLSTTVRLKVLELPVWSVSPPYTAEIPIAPSFPRLGV
jgi:hypothetical protein